MFLQMDAEQKRNLYLNMFVQSNNQQPDNDTNYADGESDLNARVMIEDVDGLGMTLSLIHI